MEYKIIEKAEIKIIGRELRVSNENGENFIVIPKFWDQCKREGICDALSEMPNVINQDVSLGVCMDFVGNNFLYVIGVEVSNFDTVPQGMVAKTIPAQKYAVFTAKGKMPEGIQQTWKDIFKKWFPASGYERANGADFEYYDHRCRRDDDQCEVDIYVPVK